MPLVSIIIPVWNAEQFIEKCVCSVLAQTFRSLDIILIDDGSTDGSGDICKRLAAEDPRVRYVSKRNEGPSSARNAGLDVATGDWLLFVDADDWLEPDYIQNFLSDGAPGADSLCFQGCKFVRGNNKIREMRFVEASSQGNLIAKNNLLARWEPWGKLFNLHIIREHHLRFDESLDMSEDALFFFGYLNWVTRIKITTGSGYCYRQTEAGALTRRRRSWETHTAGACKLRDSAVPQVRRFCAGCLAYRRRFLNMLCFEQFAHRLPFLYADGLPPDERRRFLTGTFGNRRALLMLAEPLFFNGWKYVLLWLLFLLTPVAFADILLAKMFNPKLQKNEQTADTRRE